MKIISAVIIFISLGEKSVAQNAMIEKLTIVRTTTPPKIDGVIDEDVWKQVPVLNDFMQAAPVPGAAPSLKTEVRMLYDNENFYVAVTAFDSVGKYNVMGLQRDKYYRNEDGVALMMDTYNDKIHSLLLFCNEGFHNHIPVHQTR